MPDDEKNSYRERDGSFSEGKRKSEAVSGQGVRRVEEKEAGKDRDRGKSSGQEEARRDASSSLASLSFTAAQWQLLSSGVRALLQFGVMVLLARLLNPAAFGLIAIAYIVVAYADLMVDLGLGAAVVQRTELTQKETRVAFTASMSAGIILALAMWALAPFFSALMRQEEVENVLRGLSLLFIFAGLGSTSYALLQRSLNLRAIFFVDLIGYGVGYAAVAVSLALLGFGVWSMVVGSLVQRLLSSLTAIYFARPPLKPLFSRAEMADLMGFGTGALANRTISYLSFNGDNFVVGRWMGAHALGLYSRAFQIMQLPLAHLGNISWSILFSAYSRMNGDIARVRNAYLKSIQMLVMGVAPIMAGMIAAGPHLIGGLYGSQWLEAVVATQILCAVGVLRAVYNTTGALTHSAGEVYPEMRRQILYALLLIGGTLVGRQWGITGVAGAVAIATFSMYFAMGQLAVRITQCGWGDFFRAQVPGWLLGVFVGSVAFLIRLILEQGSYGSSFILGAVIVTCLLALPSGVYLLPPRIRPVELFHTLEPAVQNLPYVLRRPLRLAMRGFTYPSPALQ